MTDGSDDRGDRAVVAFDLGTTNTAVARWAGDDAVMVNIGDCCRLQEPGRTPLIPSALLGLDASLDGALIGQQALDQDSTRRRVIRRFKPRLAEEGTLVVHRVGGRGVQAREAARVFVRAVLEAYRRVMPDDFPEIVTRRFLFSRRSVHFPRLVIPAPVDYFENYRAELREIAIDLGYEDVEFIDEPLASALGLAVRAEREQHVLVVDFGGGTCDVAVVRLGAEALRQGRSRAVAKCGEDLGGDLIDYWLMDEMCRRQDATLEQFEHIRGMLKDAAENLKVRLSGEASADASVFDDRSGRTMRIELSRAEFEELLVERRLFRNLESILDRALQQAAGKGVREEEIEAVLLVGGSTLIPSVRTFIEDRFGADRVLAGNPFAAVARGAAAFGAGARVADVLQHDYGVLVARPTTWDAGGYIEVPGDDNRCVQVLFAQGEVCPTEPVVRCYQTGAMGGEQRRFHVSIYEVARDGSLSLVINPETGLPEEQREMRLRPLNIDDPTICALDPPSTRAERRVEITYRVDEARWLRIDVRDLRTGEILAQNRAVVQLRR